MHFFTNDLSYKSNKIVLLIMTIIWSQDAQRLVFTDEYIHDFKTHYIARIAFLALRDKHFSVEVAEGHELNFFKWDIDKFLAIFFFNDQPVVRMQDFSFELYFNCSINSDSAPV